MPLNTQKTAIVTSAARGIGLATAKLFLKEGWRVAMVDQDAEELSAATADLDSVIALNLDIASPKNAQAMRRYTLSAFGHIDALVNNAGVADFCPIEDTTYERWREVFGAVQSCMRRDSMCASPVPVRMSWNIHLPTTPCSTNWPETCFLLSTVEWWPPKPRGWELTSTKILSFKRPNKEARSWTSSCQEKRR